MEKVKMKRKIKREKKGWTWNFYKMHPVLQVIAWFLGSGAIVGFVLYMNWFLYYIAFFRG